MAVPKIGIDFDVFKDITPPNLSVSNSSKEILAQIPERANALTNGWLGYGILGTIFMSVFYVLADKTPLGDFGYDNLPALSLSFAICSIFGIVLLSGNFINNFIVISTSIFMMLLTMIIIILTETK